MRGFHIDINHSISVYGNVMLMPLQIRDINELSRQEVDEIINLCSQKDWASSSDDIHRR